MLASSSDTHADQIQERAITTPRTSAGSADSTPITGARRVDPERSQAHFVVAATLRGGAPTDNRRGTYSEGWEATTSRADVRIAGNRCTGDLQTYRIQASVEEIIIDVTLVDLGQRQPHADRPRLVLGTRPGRPVLGHRLGRHRTQALRLHRNECLFRSPSSQKSKPTDRLVRAIRVRDSRRGRAGVR
jgi:hypothetical protein